MSSRGGRETIFKAEIINSRAIVILAGLTIIGFPALARIIFEFSVEDQPFVSILFTKSNLFLEIIVGAVYGVLSGVIAWLLVRSELLKSVRLKYQRLITGFELSNQEIIFISICAGVGEEILFRGVLQPLYGIWIVAAVFVAIHGYLSPKNWRLSIYGVVMTIIIVGVGYMSKYLGLTSAIIAHTMIDIVLLKKLSSSSLQT